MRRHRLLAPSPPETAAPTRAPPPVMAVTTDLTAVLPSPLHLSKAPSRAPSINRTTLLSSSPTQRRRPKLHRLPEIRHLDLLLQRSTRLLKSLGKFTSSLALFLCLFHQVLWLGARIRATPASFTARRRRPPPPGHLQPPLAVHREINGSDPPALRVNPSSNGQPKKRAAFFAKRTLQFLMSQKCPST
jgi:hypothetical protein